MNISPIASLFRTCDHTRNICDHTITPIAPRQFNSARSPTSTLRDKADLCSRGYCLCSLPSLSRRKERGGFAGLAVQLCQNWRIQAAATIGITECFEVGVLGRLCEGFRGGGANEGCFCDMFRMTSGWQNSRDPVYCCVEIGTDQADAYGFPVSQASIRLETLCLRTRTSASPSHFNADSQPIGFEQAKWKEVYKGGANAAPIMQRGPM